MDQQIESRSGRPGGDASMIERHEVKQCRTCNFRYRESVELMMNRGHSSICVLWHLRAAGVRLSVKSLDKHYEHHTNLYCFDPQARQFPSWQRGWYIPEPVPPVSTESTPELLLIRGVPGSGKSRLAWAYSRTHLHLEADQYFFQPTGEFRFEREYIHDAHTWCEEWAMDALQHRRSVVVANTFVRNIAFHPYFAIADVTGASIRIVELPDPWPRRISTLTTPDILKKMSAGRFQRMRRQWESVDIPVDCAHLTVTVEQASPPPEYAPMCRPFYCKQWGCIQDTEL